MGKDDKSIKTKGSKGSSTNRAQEIHQEKIAHLQKLLEEKGLNFEENEIPPDDVDPSIVSKTAWQQFRSLIPYTDEWYESRQAETEMDDLTRMRLEKAKAKDLLAMTKAGKHEEALEEMMAQTNNDFFFFNKLMTKMQEEGTFSFDKPELNPFENLQKGAGRNRIKKAAVAQFNVIDDGAMKIASAQMNANIETSGEKKIPPQDMTALCIWRGKNKEGEFLKCSNLRMLHPFRKVKITTGAEEAEQLQHCGYHNTKCINDEKHDGTVVSISMPNKESLCVECFLMKSGSKPTVVLMEACPGVSPITISTITATTTAAEDSNAKEVNADFLDNKGRPLTENTRCCWIPEAQNIAMRGWICEDAVFFNKQIKKLVRTCPMHIKFCIRPHVDNVGSLITKPNREALCENHYLSEMGVPVPNIPWPYPKMRKKNNTGQGKKHFASPHWAPSYDLEIIEYEPPDEPEDYFEASRLQLNQYLWRRQFRKKGKWAQTIVAKYFRRFRVQNEHRKKKAKEDIIRRNIGALKIQMMARTYIAKGEVAARRKLFNDSALLIERVWRGHICRWKMYVQWAARRIQKLMKKIRFFKIRDTVIMATQLKQLFRKRNTTVIQIQRVARGYLARRTLFEEKIWRYILKRSAKIIQRRIRKFLLKRKRRGYVLPSNEWVLDQCRNHLAIMIFKLYQEYLDRLKRREKFNLAAPHIQKLVRGFLARRGCIRLYFLRNAMRSWMSGNVDYAKHYMERFYEKKDFRTSNKPIIDEMQEEVNRKRKEREEANRRKGKKVQKVIRTRFVRDHLPPETEKDFLITVKDFISGLSGYYNECGCPLLQSEQQSLINRFKEHGTGRMKINQVETYIQLHSVPCRTHGRMICGQCAYLDKCTKDGCKCTKYVSEGHKQGLCKTCLHAADIHLIAPLCHKESNSNASEISMLAILSSRAQQDPDLTAPDTVVGVTINEVIIKEEDPEVLRHEREEKEKLMETLKKTDFNKKRSMELSKQLSFRDIMGDKMYNRRDYWDLDFTLDMMKPPEESIQSIEVSTYDIKPNYDLTPAEFWNNAKKLPNKTLRDYDEKFEHSMPLAIIDDYKLTYTIEGPKIYMNILLKIIDMHQKDEIHYDNPIMLRLVTDHIQVFERHWRKMVADLREGKLNRHVTVSKDARTLYESTAIPRPSVARVLDDTFRKLGFHAKTGGKAMEEFGKPPPQFGTLKRFHPSDPRARRPSLPITPGHSNEEGGGNSSKPSSPSRTSPLRRSSSLLNGSLDALCSPIGTSHSLSINETPTRKSTSPITSKSLSLTSDQPLTRNLTRKQKEKLEISHRLAKKKQALLDFGRAMGPGGVMDQFEAQEAAKSIRGPGRYSREGSTGLPNRSGSDTDILRPATALQLNAIEYDHETAARAEYTEAVKSGNFFICPFPACGKTFFSKDAALKHLPFHEQRNRLAAPTPLADSHLTFYWPKQVPWNFEKRFTRRAIPPGSVACTFDGCTMVFPTTAMMEQHLRNQHSTTGPSHLSRGYFSFEGNCVTVPPNNPPHINAPLKYCPNHMNPSGKCSLCISIEPLRGIPKFPFRIYSKIIIDLSKKDLKNKDADPILRIDIDSNCGVIFNTSSDSQLSSRGVVVGILIDSGKNAWAAITKYIGHHEAIAINKKLPRDYDQTFELIELESDGSAQWYPIHSIQSKFNMFFMSKERFRSMIKNGKIPKRNSYFKRIEDNFIEEEETDQNT